jgi:serine/threonine protein phosphatase PrpC
VAQRNSSGKITSHKKMRLSLPSPSSQSFSEVNSSRPFKISACTLPGLLTTGEDKPCQDSFFFTTYQDMLLCAVFDGHGPVGESVSSEASSFISNYFKSNAESFQSDPKEFLSKMLEACDKSLLESSLDIDFSGSTAAILLLCQDSIHTAGLGDSRAILATLAEMSFALPAQKNKYCRTWPVSRVLKPIPLTVDQKPNHSEEFLRIRKAGGRVERVRDICGNQIGPFRVWLQGQDYPGLAMSRSLGDRVGKSVGVISTPVYHYFTRYHQSDQFIVIASDGVWDVFENMEVVNFVEWFKDKSQEESFDFKYPARCDNSNVSRLLCEEARLRWFGLVEMEDIHIDDITCVVIDFSTGGDLDRVVDRNERNVSAFRTIVRPAERSDDEPGMDQDIPKTSD